MSAEGGFKFQPSTDAEVTEMERAPEERNAILDEGSLMNTATAAWETEISKDENEKLRQEISQINDSVRKGERLTFNPDERIAELEDKIHALENGSSLEAAETGAKTPHPEVVDNIEVPVAETSAVAAAPEDHSEKLDVAFNNALKRAEAKYDTTPLGGVKTEQVAESRRAYQEDYQERSERSFDATGIKDPNYRWNTTTESETLPATDDPRRKEVPAPRRGWISRLFNL